MKLSKNLLWMWRALPQGYVRYRLLSFMFCGVVVERENWRKGQNRTMCIFLNLLCCVSFQICCVFSKPWGLFLRLLLHCSPWDTGAPQPCVHLLLWGSVCSTGPSRSSFSLRCPNIRGPKKKIPYWSTFRFIFWLSVTVICTVLLAPGYLHHAGTKKWRKWGGCLALWRAALPDRININLQNCCDSSWNVIPFLKHLLWG